MLEYSDRKNKTKVVAAYSTLKPETSSDSASGKSKGTLFVSAKAAIKNINKLGQKGITKKTLVWKLTIFVKFNDPMLINTTINITPMTTSYEINWAADLKDPKKAYLEFEDHPEIIIP